MKNLFLGMSLLLMGALSACSGEDIAEDAPTNTPTIIATVEGEEPWFDSRAGIARGGLFFWTGGDQLVLSMDNVKTEKYSGSSVFSIGEGAGLPNATFTGVMSPGEKLGSYAVNYPQDYWEDGPATGFDETGENLVYIYPKEYTYTHVDQTPPSGDENTLKEYNPWHFAMAGKIDGNRVLLKKLGATLIISVPKMKYKSGRFVLRTNCKISGQFTLPVNKIGTEEAYFTCELLPRGSFDEVVIHYSNATVGKPGLFFFPIPTGVYKKWEIIRESEFAQGDPLSYKGRPLEMKRNTSLVIPMQEVFTENE